MTPPADAAWPRRRVGATTLVLRSLRADRAVLTASAVAVAVTVALAAAALFAAVGIHASEQASLASGLDRVPLVVRGPGGGAGTVVGGSLAVPEVAVGQAATVPGVAWAEGDVAGYARVQGAGGRWVGGLGEPAIGVSVGRSSPLGALTVVRGRLPSGPDQMVTDPTTAATGRLRLGQRVAVAFAGDIGYFTLVGEVVPVGSRTVVGATLAGFDLAAAVRAFGTAGSVSQVEVGLVPGADPGRVAAAVAAAVGPGLRVVTGRAAGAGIAAAAAGDLAFVPGVLGALAAAALVVALFVTANAVSLVGERRRRDLALARLAGAPGWWAGAVPAGTAATTGLVAAAAGTGLAIVGLPVAGRLAAASGVGIPLTPGVTPASIAVAVAAVALGPLVALAAAARPARRAARLAPLDGLTVGEPGDPAGGGHRRRGWALPALGLVAGPVVTAAAAGWFGGAPPLPLVARMAAVGAGALVAGAGALGCLARLARSVPPARRGGGGPRAFGWRRAWSAGPRATSLVAVVGASVAVLAAVATLAASARTALATAVVGSVRADLVAVPAQLEPFPGATLAPGPLPAALAAVAAVHVGTVTVDGAARRAYGVDPASWERLVVVHVVGGSLRALAGGGVAISASLAASAGVHAGGSLPLDSPRAGPVAVPVRAVYADDPVAGDLVMPTATFADLVPDDGVLFVLAASAPAVPMARARAALAGMVAGTPGIDVLDRAGFVSLVSAAVDRAEAALGTLAAAASLGALAGVAEAMVVGVLARRRELWLLWAVGMPPAGLRAAVRWEALSLAAAGTVLGAAVGIPAGWAALAVVVPGGWGAPVLPVGALAAVAAGVVAVAALAVEVPARWAGGVGHRHPAAT